MRVTFKVLGQAKGKARPRFANGQVYTPSETKKYEQQVRKAYLTASSGYTFGDKPVMVSIATYFKRAKSNKREFATSKPDIDNVAKSILDGLNGTAFDDDKQVTHLTVNKLYCESSSEMPYTIVIVTDEETN